MKIKEINIHNFRILRDAHVELKPNMNLFVGINGAGKSTILHALRILVSWFTARMISKSGKGLALSNDDISNGEDACRLEVELDNGRQWSLYKQRTTLRKDVADKSDLSEMNSYIKELYNDNTDDTQLTSVPFIAYYGVDRAVTNVPVYVGKKHLLKPVDIYSNFTEEKINFRSFFEWFKEREDIENEQYRRDHDNFMPDRQLKAVREAIESALPGYRNLHIQRDPRAILVEKNGEPFKFDQLSDGEKCYITLIGDIARKIAMANPNMYNPLDAEGIVFIDEVDLHLHPSWQQNVIMNLENAFSNVQFIITTHSPFVVSSTEISNSNTILTVDNGTISELIYDAYGAPVQDVLSRVFELDTLRNREVQQHINELWSILREPNYNRELFNEKLRWLRGKLNSSDIEFVNLKLQQAMLEKQGGKQ